MSQETKALKSLRSEVYISEDETAQYWSPLPGTEISDALRDIIQRALFERRVLILEFNDTLTRVDPKEIIGTFSLMHFAKYSKKRDGD